MLPTEYAQLITDEVSDTVTYIGYCMTNFTPTSEPLWAIYRVTSESGTTPQGVTVIEGANSPGDFTEVWDNRTSLTYRS